MKTGVWISYDLGIKGDYPGLYKWLDSKKAKECGNSVAFVFFEYKTDLQSEILADLDANVNFKNGDRIYIIGHVDSKNPNKIVGKYLFGNRKANPWEGYAPTSENEIDGL